MIFLGVFTSHLLGPKQSSYVRVEWFGESGKLEESAQTLLR